MTPTQAILIGAVLEADKHNAAWWNDTTANSIIDNAVKRGWMHRPSVTQFQWTGAGAAAYMAAIPKN